MSTFDRTPNMPAALRTRRIIAPVLSLALSACRPTPALDTTVPLVAVAVSIAQSESIAQPVTATGTFGSRDHIPLAFKMAGVISRVAVDEGQAVRRGQLLASLDLRETDAMLDKAKLAVDKADRDQARVARLAADSVATSVQLQDATSALDAARADLRLARINREFAVIVAPEDGVIQQRTATAGSTIAAGTTVLQLGGSARGRVLRAGLPDRDALRIRVGDQGTVRFDALPGRQFRAHVSLLGRSADPRTGTYTVEVTLSGAADLPGGLVGRLEVATKASAPATMIPVDALLEADADSAFVFVLAAGAEPVAQQQRVRIVTLSGDRAAVVGLAAHARVVTRGAPYVTPGAKVRVIADTAVADMPVVRSASERNSAARSATP